MKAARIHEHGGPEVLVYEDIPEPQIRAHEALIRVRVCALNHLDLFIRAGLAGVPLPQTLGSDIAGEVVRAGELCRNAGEDRRVLLAPGVSCRVCPHCVSGRDNRCPNYTLFGYGVPGGYAEYVAAPDYAVIPIPDDLTFEEAAAVPLVFLTAWHMLVTEVKLQPGEDVLVIAASSGVGSAAIQIAKLFHCRVIATAGGEHKLEAARKIGADHAIDHYRQDIAAEVKKITGRRGVDVVLEHVGAATWDGSMRSLAAGGRIVTCGATTGGKVNVDLRYLFAKQQSIHGTYMGTLGELHAVLKFVFRKQLHAVLDRVFPLSDARAAHEYLENKEQFGKVLVKP